MLLKRLFTSQTRVKLLTLFLTNPEEEYFIRELTRRLDEQINSVRRELDNLKKFGLLRSRMKNRKKYYMINQKFPLITELQGIILKSTDQNAKVVEAILKLGDLELLLLSGFFLKKDSEVDLLIVGEIDKDVLQSFLDKEVPSDRTIRYTALTREDFIYRVKCNDRFIKDLLTDPENMIAHNQLQNALS
ncbi:hypothetical protein HN748_06425 [Candidatus Peregrinibacteria bacterium]|jgi:hypothetical protein|nr:hypothetical protein [Candidatus Peregrinibacteria bacterium]MBT7483142.1 hypothetical protein [Candidatus Peregrinibacteria bacterium]MBT7703838.1 hypothetical protein [Candidatus Peregrinibacteria bacterium]